MIDFVTFLWNGGRNVFSAAHVNRLKAMVARHYRGPHRFTCVTNIADGLDPSIRIVRDEKEFPLARPDIAYYRQYPEQTCYRRLRLYAEDAAALFGERICALDLDIVIVDDMTAAFDRSEDIVLLEGTPNSGNAYNGSVQLIAAGARPEVYETFDPVQSPVAARQAGFRGTDQAWLAHCLGPDEAKFTEAGGFYNWRVKLKPKGGRLPDGARLVNFAGQEKPWSAGMASIPWINEHYR